MSFKAEIEKAIEAATRLRPPDDVVPETGVEPSAPTATDDWLSAMSALSFALNAAPIMEDIGRIADRLTRQGHLDDGLAGRNKARAVMPINLKRFDIGEA